MSTLLPEFPKELRAARIGTCYNPISRKLMSKNIIDTSRLDSSAIDMIHGKGQLQLRADASTAQNTQKTYFGLDSNFKIGSWVTLGFNMETSLSEASTSDTLNCYCSYIYSGQSLVLLDKGPENLFNYLTEEFQTDLIKLLNEKNPANFLKLYFGFLQKFGYGCITELDLTSGTAFKMNVSYSSKALATSAKYGGSVSVGTPWGGGSAASSFAKEVLATDGNATLDFVAEQLPEDTPTKEWSSALIATLLSKGLSELSKRPEMITPYTGTSPKAPDIPKGNPTKKKLSMDNTPQVNKELQEHLMQEDAFSGTWEEYIEAQKDAYNKLKPEKVVKELLENREHLLSLELEEISGVVPQEEYNDSGTAWDLGGYIPCNYTVKSWIELFPQLKSIGMPTTFTSIFIAKAYVYYLTRMEFASYMYLLADIGAEICENDSIAIDAEIYASACGRLVEKISELINNAGDVFTATDYNKVVAYFEQEIEKLSHFYSKTTYRAFFDNYAFFANNACGFILVFGDFIGKSYTPTYYLAKGKPPLEGKDAPRPLSVVKMLTDGLRYYPVLTPQGNLKMYAFNNSQKRWWRSVDIIGGIKGERKKDKDGCYYYNSFVTTTNTDSPLTIENTAFDGDVNESRYYSAGFSELNALKNATVMGRPMINPFDYESILQFCDPDKPLGKR